MGWIKIEGVGQVWVTPARKRKVSMPRKKKEPDTSEFATVGKSDPQPDYKTPKPMKLDAKFYAAVHKVKNGESVPDDQWMIFLAKDNAFPATLRFYLNECRQLGADQEHCESVERTIRRVDEWRAANPDKCKVPDAKGEKLLG